MIVAGISFGVLPAQAKFNTVAAVSARYKVEVLRTATDKTETPPEKAAPVPDTSAELLAAASPVEVDRKMWQERYLSVS